LVRGKDILLRDISFKGINYFLLLIFIKIIIIILIICKINF